MDEQGEQRIEPLLYQLKEWQRLIKYLPPTDCDRDDVGEIEELVKKGIASQQAVEADAYCNDCGGELVRIRVCPKCKEFGLI